MTTTTQPPRPAPPGPPFVRLTVLGPERNANLVLPTDQPAALLLPQVLALLDEASVTGRYELTTLAGRLIDQNRPLRESGLTDGDLVRLSRSGEEAAAPVVMDVVDVVEGAPLAGTWTPATKSWVHALLGTVVLLAGVGLLADALGDGAREVLWPVASAVGLCLAAALTAVRRPLLRPASWSLLVAGTGLGVLAVLTHDVDTPGRLQALGLAVLALLAAGVCAGRLPVLAVAAALLAALSGGWAAVWVLTDHQGRAAAVMGVVSVLLLGLVPRLALSVSGLFSVDSSIMRGERVTRARAGAAVVEAHWLLGCCVPVVAVSLAASGWLLARDGDLTVWPAVMLALLGLCWLLRGRHFPLAFERLSIGLAVVPGAVAVGLQVADRTGAAEAVAAGALALGAGVLLLGTWSPSDYTGAQLRRAATRLETLTVLALVPVCVGTFGVYGQLLDSFG